MNFKKIGKNVFLSPYARFYNPQNIEIGDNVRIDDFCVLSGGSGLRLGSHIHIAVHCSLFAGSGIDIGDFCNIAAYSLLLSESDDYMGRSLIGPIIPKDYKPTYKSGKIVLEKHVSLGTRTTIMPGVTMKEGSITGSNSLVLSDCDPWTVNIGTPAKFFKKRFRDIISLADKFLEKYNA